MIEKYSRGNLECTGNGVMIEEIGLYAHMVMCYSKPFVVEFGECVFGNDQSYHCENFSDKEREVNKGGRIFPNEKIVVLWKNENGYDYHNLAALGKKINLDGYRVAIEEGVGEAIYLVPCDEYIRNGFRDVDDVKRMWKKQNSYTSDGWHGELYKQFDSGNGDGELGYRLHAYEEGLVRKTVKKVLREYLDRENLKPMYDYLKKSERYSSHGHFGYTYKMVYPFFVYMLKESSDETFEEFRKVVNKNQICDGKIIIGNDRHRYCRCYNKLMNGDINEVPMKDFLTRNAQTIFRSTYQNGYFTDLWDEFMLFIETRAGIEFLKANQFLDADTALMDPEIKKTQWLLHFTAFEDDALDICRNGFKYGLDISQKERMAYTNKNLTRDDKHGKMSYAFNAEDVANGHFITNTSIPRDEWAFGNMFDQKAWEQAMHYVVMFKSSGIEAYHGTDRQYQVIFNTDNAKDFVLLKYGMDQNPNPKDTRHMVRGRTNSVKWMVMANDGSKRCLYYNSSLSNVVKWVMDNFAQYRKQICWK